MRSKKYYEELYYKYSNYAVGSYLKKDYRQCDVYAQMALEFKRLIEGRTHQH